MVVVGTARQLKVMSGIMMFTFDMKYLLIINEKQFEIQKQLTIYESKSLTGTLIT